MKDSSEIILDGEKYISASDAARLCGYTRIYVGQLCRGGKVKSTKLGTDWFVSEKSILEYRSFILRPQEEKTEKEVEIIVANKPIFHQQDYPDEWDAAIFGKPSRKRINFGKFISKLDFKQFALSALSLVFAASILWNPIWSMEALGRAAGVASQGVATAFDEVKKAAKFAAEIPESKFNLKHSGSLLALSFEFKIPDLPSLPFSWEDATLAVLDIKIRFLSNLSAWRGYFASLGGDLKLVAEDFFSVGRVEIAEAPVSTPPQPNLTQPSPSKGEEPVKNPLLTKEGKGEVKESSGASTVIERIERIISGVTQENLDQRLSSLNQTILSQVQLSLAALEKRLPPTGLPDGRPVQNPVVFLTTSIPGPTYNSPPQTGSGVSASFGDFSNGISTGGNLTASGNVTLGSEGKSLSLTSSTWNLTSGGALSGLSSLSLSGALTSGSLTVSSATISGGSLAFGSSATTTIPASLLNAFSFATSTTAVPFLTFDTLNYKIGIGTTSPSKTFSVSGDGIFSGSLSVGGSLIADSSGITVSGTTTSSNPLVASFSPVTTHAFSSWAIGAANSAVTNASVVINPASAAADTNLFGAAVNGSVRFLVDADGDVFANAITLSGGSSLATTSINTLTIENNATFGDAIGDSVTLIAGTLSFNNFATTTIASSSPALSNSSINALTFATSSTSTRPLLSFDTTNARVGILTFSPQGRLDVGGGQFIVTAGGSVGVGTTTPSNLFSVQGNAYISGNLASVSNITATGTLSVTGKTTLTNASSTWLTASSYFQAGGDAGLNILSTGFTGLGTTTPASLFSVQGNGLFSGNLSLANLTATGTLSVTGKTTLTNASSTWLTASSYFQAGGDAGLTVLSTGLAGFGTTSPAQLLSIQGNALISGNLTSVSNITATGTLSVTGATTLGFASTTGITASQYLQAAGAAGLNVLSTGFTGLGTTTPASLFSVQGNGLFSGNLSLANLTATGTLTFSGLGTDMLASINSSGQLVSTSTPVLASLVATSTTATSTFAGGLAVNGTGFVINQGVAANSFNINASGNVGIGTTSPAGLLSVEMGSQTFPFWVGDEGTSTPAFVVRGSGNVGIGATNPYLKMEISGTQGFPATSGTSQVGSLRLRTGAVSMDFGTESDTVGRGWIQINHRDDLSQVYPLLLNPNGGNVGIGTTSPQQFMEGGTNTILNISSASNATILAIHNRSSAQESAISTPGTGLNISVAGHATAANNVINFRTSNTDSSYSVPIRMTIAYNGNVGIGTTSPAGLLHLNSGANGDDAQIFIGGARDPGWTVPAVQFGERNTIYSRTAVSGLNIAYNAYTSGSDHFYIGSFGSSKITVDGSIGFDTAASGSAGGAISYTRAMTIDGGNVGITMPGTQNTVGTCHSTDGTGGVASSNFLVDCSSAPGDIAEWYETRSDVETGDIVTPSSDTALFKSISGIGTITDDKGNRTDGVPLPGATTTISILQKSQKAYDWQILGIVSTAPYQTFGEDVKETALHPQRIALNGRVPVKVNLEGGAIKIGDRITSSSVAGVGMRATTSGITVGIALEPFDDAATTTGKILVFVNLGYSKLDDAVSNLAVGQPSGGWIIDQASGRVKTSYTLDMDNKDIVNARNILSVNGNWSINESGLVVVDVLETRKGVTTYDMANGQAYCIRVINAQISALSGKCSDLPTNAGLSAPAPEPAPEPVPETAATSSEPTAATSTEPTASSTGPI